MQLKCSQWVSYIGDDDDDDDADDDDTATRGWVLDRVHRFALCDPVTLTFDVILIDGRGLVMDYPHAKFGDFSFSRFGFAV